MLDAAGRRVLTAASGPCPRPEVVVAVATANPTPLAPAAGPLATIAGDIAFDFDGDRIRPEFYPELDRIAAALRENPAERLTLTGHTDAIGPEPYNQGLSERRARSVAAYLQRAGVPGDRLVTSGAGEGRPVAAPAADLQVGQALGELAEREGAIGHRRSGTALRAKMPDGETVRWAKKSSEVPTSMNARGTGAGSARA